MQHNENLGIGSLLDYHAKNNPKKIAIYYEDTLITYKSFKQSVVSYQNILKQILNPKQTKKVALLLGNEPMFLEVYFAVIMLGWIAIPFDPKWTNSEAKRIKEIAEPDLILINDLFKDTTSYEFQEAISLNKINTVKFVNEPLSYTHAKNDFYLGFTSGSTGTPKGFLRNHKSWLRSFEVGESIFNYNKDDILMAPGPLNHSLSLFGATHALHSGASFCLTTSFSAPIVFDLIKKHNVTVMYGVPTMFHSLASLRKEYTQPITCLSSGAKLDTQIKNQLQLVFPNTLMYEYYGASELSYITYATDSFSKKHPESVGLPFPSVQLTIRNQEGKKLPKNHIGDIYVKSDFLFSEYFKNEQATKETLTKYGAFIGDVGFLDERGALTVVGRKNNMIITGGQNVYPEEVEKVIKKSDAVKEAVIIGLNNVHWGEKIVAFIEWKDDCHPDLASVKKLCKTHLSIYKRPRKYIPVANFPYTHTGKIAREQIKNNLKELAK